ncbi:MAG: porphobilinogen synthase, partial [Pseudomonadota bacterium]|nr:porphobilinogen synthase [Pseudomonadota bacterium]
MNTHDLIQPIFVTEGKGVKEPIKTMPGINRLSIDLAVEKCKILSNLNIPAVAVFPVIKPSKKTPEGSEAFNPEGLLQQAVRNIKKSVPDLGLKSHVALDPFTPQGHVGFLNKHGDILNDETIESLIKQSSSLAE